jgi:hypothetical protein
MINQTIGTITLAFITTRVNTPIMSSFVPATFTGLPDRSTKTKSNSLCDVDPKGFAHIDSAANWVPRGMKVGFMNGLILGTIVPIIGNVIGAVVGMLAGIVIGIAVAFVCGIARAIFPHSRNRQNRERVLATLTIVFPLLLITVTDTTTWWLWLPALPGVLHAVAAGTPEAGDVYTGDISDNRKMFVYFIPLISAVVIGLGFAIVKS